MAKLDQAVVLYMGSQLLDRAGEAALARGHGAACGKCMMLLADTSECSILNPAKVSARHGVCGLFVGGKPATTKDHPAMRLVPKDVAGYIEGEGIPTHCGNCRNFVPPDACQKVEGTVEEYGCCNAWELKKSQGAPMRAHPPMRSRLLEDAAHA